MDRVGQTSSAAAAGQSSSCPADNAGASTSTRRPVTNPEVPLNFKSERFSLDLYPELEARFWTLRCTQLVRLDAMFELCQSAMWASMLNTLHGTRSIVGTARLALAVAQLMLMYFAPRTWGRHRCQLLSTAQVAALLLLLPLLPPLPAIWDGSSSAAAAAAASQECAGSCAADRPALPLFALLATGCWSQLLFVVFHQQPLRLQVPLLLFGSAVQAAHVMAAAAVAAEAPSAALTSVMTHLDWAFHHLLASFTGGSGVLNLSADKPTGERDALNSALLSPAADALPAAVLFLHMYGSLLLPLCAAYLLEWWDKVNFLLLQGSSPEDRLRVLTPMAAVLHSSPVLATLLCGCWLLLLAVGTWLLSSAAVLALPVPRGRATCAVQL